MSAKNLLSHTDQLLRELGVETEQNVGFRWMSNRVPLSGEVPPRIRYRLIAVHTRLGGEWSELEKKRAMPLRFDFRVEDTILVELDTRHHFSSARRTTLDFYDGLRHSLDFNSYRDLCNTFSTEADRYQAKREALDFPFPGGRTAQRAYFDFAKDVLAPAHGFRLIRIPVANEEQVEKLELRLRVLL
jgi:hypothetical protein